MLSQSPAAGEAEEQVLVELEPVEGQGDGLAHADVLQGRVRLLRVEQQYQPSLKPEKAGMIWIPAACRPGMSGKAMKMPRSASPDFSAATCEASSGTKRKKISSIFGWPSQ